MLKKNILQSLLSAKIFFLSQFFLFLWGTSTDMWTLIHLYFDVVVIAAIVVVSDMCISFIHLSLIFLSFFTLMWTGEIMWNTHFWSEWTFWYEHNENFIYVPLLLGYFFSLCVSINLIYCQRYRWVFTIDFWIVFFHLLACLETCNG